MTTTTTPTTTPTVARRRRRRMNLFLRGRTYYWRRVVGGKEFIRSTGQTDYTNAAKIATTFDKALDTNTTDEIIGKKAAKAPAPGFEAFARAYLAIVQPAMTAKRARTLSDNLAPAIEHFGATPVDAIAVEDCEAFLTFLRTRSNGRGGTLTPGTQAKHVTAAITIMNRAVRLKHRKDQPFRDVDKKLRPMQDPRGRTVSVDEQRRFLAVASPEVARAFLTILGTGVRHEELILLTAAHINFASAPEVLTLTKDITKGRKERMIAPQPFAVRALSEQIKARAEGTLGTARSRKRDPNSSALFNVGACTVNRWFQDVQDAMRPTPDPGKTRGRSDYFTPHDVRRTYATRMADAGYPIAMLSQDMGHSRIEITAKYYIKSDALARFRKATSMTGIFNVPTPKVVNIREKKAKAR